MAHHNNRSLTLCAAYLFVSHKLNSFCVTKALAILLVIYGDFIIQRNTFNAAASKTSLFAKPTVAAHNNHVVAINNFNGDYLNKHQIAFDTFQLKLYAADDNNLLLSSIKNFTRTSNCRKKLCDTNVSTAAAEISSGRNKITTFIPNPDTMTNTITNVTKNVLCPSSISPTLSPLVLQQQRLLLRPKRYLSFPEGSSFSVAVCFTVGIIGNPRYNYMSFGLNWGVAYDLPNTTWILNHLHGFAKRPIPVAVWHRRSRRSLYQEIEKVVDNMGYNGRDCILRALCESRQYFQKTKMSMIGEMLRAIFSLPKQRVYAREVKENSDIELYDRAYRKARSIVDCSQKYDCGFSLLELAFGKYSTPPPGYYTTH